MSTKIYNGYEVVGLRNMSDIHAWIEAFRGRIQKKARTLAIDVVTSIAIRRIDRASTGLDIEKPEDMPLAHAAGLLSDWYQKSWKDGYRGLPGDLDCHITLIPVTWKGMDRLLGLLWAEQRTYTRMWARLPEVKDFSYWDNTDPPSSMRSGKGYAAWKERGEIWDVALGNKPPSIVGYTTECLGKYGCPRVKIKDVLRAVPKCEARVKSLARDIVLEERYALQQTEGLVKRLMEAGAWMKDTDEGRARLAQVEAEVRAKIKPWIAATDLAKYPENEW